MIETIIIGFVKLFTSVIIKLHRQYDLTMVTLLLTSLAGLHSF